MSQKIDQGRKVAIDFLRNYRDFGSRVHLLSAELFYRATESLPNIEDRKILSIKVFSEFFASLEDLGAMCIAIRHRDDNLGIVYAYLSYGLKNDKLSPPTSLLDMYKMLVDGNGLEKGLNLPPITSILKSKYESEQSDFTKLYKEANTVLAQAAKVYLEQDSALLRAYNKTKHGFVVVSGKYIFQSNNPAIKEDSAWIVAKNPKYSLSNRDKSVVELFEINNEDSKLMLDRIPMVRGALMFITDLTATLLEQNIISCADNNA